VINEDRLFGGKRLARFDVSLQPGSLVSVHLDDFNGDPMILNLPDPAKPIGIHALPSSSHKRTLTKSPGTS
jgi:hypothetical protein